MLKKIIVIREISVKKMKIPIYQIDAFTCKSFKGNPAAVCVLDDWLETDVMQKIAAENNLSETAFVVKKNNKFSIRWFTPKIEVDLCGHATLASAFVVFKEIHGFNSPSITFDSQSGPLTVWQKENNLLTLDFPSRKPEKCSKPELLDKALGIKSVATFESRDLLVILENEEQVKNLDPNFYLLSQIKKYLGIIVSAKGNEADFVSRFFVPSAGIPEDPVTGSAHCTLIPFWAEILKKEKLHALQLSQRGGKLFCESSGERVLISGNAVKYFEGEIVI